MNPLTTRSSRKRGRLDGLTILRFAHAFESGGGVECHLADLNRELGRRNRITTIQMQLTLDANRLEETEWRTDQSMLLTVPLLVKPDVASPQRDGYYTVGRSLLRTFTERVLDLILRTQGLNDFAMQHFLKWRVVPHRAGEPEGAGIKAAEIMRRFKVDLVVLHTSGGSDTSEIIEAARAAGIPVAIVHHFSNDRLRGISLRQQISSVHGVAGASLIGVPAYLQKCFWNLSDAVDTEFFRRDSAQPPPKNVEGHVLYAPARITPEKGQADVVEVASILKRRGLNPRILFAGRIDSPDFAVHLQHIAAQKGLSGAVEFLGPLSLEEYRDWYCAAQVMVMPTHHNEGMPRTLLDSQAMQVPPVVYDIGGTSEGIRDKETGFLIRMGDIEEMAKAVETIIRSPELHNSMAEAGRQFVETTFSLRAFAERHEDYYSHVLAHAGSRVNLAADVAGDNGRA